MDPLIHLLIPMLLLLAIGLDLKKVLIWSPLAIVPDLDALAGIHRAGLHSFIPLLLVPIAIIVWANYRRPAFLTDALIILFYLMSHFVLDLGGVAFFWPFTSEMMYLDPQITVTFVGGFDIDFVVDYGFKPYEPMTTSDLLSEAGFAMLFMLTMLAVVFRKEFKASVLAGWRAVKGFLYRYQK